MSGVTNLLIVRGATGGGGGGGGGGGVGAPDPVTDLTGVASGTTSLLNWSDSPAPDFATFRTFRGTQPNPATGTWTLIGSPVLSTTTDAGRVAGQTYYYYVTVLDTEGLESAPSNVVSVSFTAPPPGGGFLLISDADLSSRASSGAPYNYLVARAADARALGTNLSGSTTPGSGTPWFPNYNNGTNSRVATKCLGAALLYAFEGGAANRQAVVNMLRYVMGSEESSAAGDTTASGDRLLATMRQLGAFVMAADLIDFDPATTGSRSGWTGTSWGTWLSSMGTKTIGTHSRWRSIIGTSENSANNWGGFAMIARVSRALYLTKHGLAGASDLADAVIRFRIFMGDRTLINSSHPQFVITSEHDASYEYIEPGQSLWIGINNATQASAAIRDGKDGLMVEDIARSAGAYPNYDDTGWDYTGEVYQALLAAAILLDQAGYPAFDYGANTTGGGQALKRVADRLQRGGRITSFGGNFSVNYHIAWIPRHFYGVDYTRVAANLGRSLAYTDWLYP